MDNAQHFGMVRTSIEVGPTFSNDYEVPEDNSLTWPDGDSAPKNITLSIIKDDQVDSEVWEKFSVHLHDPMNTVVDPQRSSITVNIHDDDGPGQVTLSLNSSKQDDGKNKFDPLQSIPIQERAVCCGGGAARSAGGRAARCGRVTGCCVGGRGGAGRWPGRASR